MTNLNRKDNMLKLKNRCNNSFRNIPDKETFTCSGYPDRVFMKRELASPVTSSGSYLDTYSAIVISGADPGNLYKGGCFDDHACIPVALEAEIVS